MLTRPRALGGRQEPRSRPGGGVEGPAEPAEAGFSLVEMIISMIVLSILMVVMLTVTLSMSRAATHDRAIADTSAKTRKVLNRVGRTLPDASVVTTPGAVGTGAGTRWYVEALVPAKPGSGSSTCLQWRVSAGLFQTRSWPTVNPIPSGWTALTDRVVNTATPFTVLVPDAGFGSYRVLFDLYVASAQGATVHEQSQFTLRNSASISGGTAVCTEVPRP